MASASSDQARLQSLFNQTTASPLTPKWRQYLERTIPASKNDPQDRVMKSAAHKEVASTEKPFRFLDLPPEQRNQIYRYCLMAPRKINCGYAFAGRPVSCIDEYYRSLMDALHWAFNPHILRTCRSIHHEATAMLYGMNKFYMDARYLSQDYLAGTILSPTNGPVKRIRHLELGPRTRVAVHPVLARIQNVISLETLTVDFTWIDCFKTPESMAKAVFVLKNQLNRAKRLDGREELGIRFFSIKMRARTRYDKRFEDNWDLAPGGRKDVAKFVPAFKKALKRMATEQQAKNIRGRVKKAPKITGTQHTVNHTKRTTSKGSIATR